MDNQFPLFPLSVTFLVFVFMLFKVWSKTQAKQSLQNQNLPPGPWKLPIIGHMHHLVSSLPHHCLRDLANKHGSLMHLQLGELSHIIVSSPEAAKQVMKTHDINFANRPPLLAAAIIFYNGTDIAFAPYGGYWRQLRKVCTLELFSAKRVQSFRSIREEEVSNLIRSISSSSNSNTGLLVNLGEMLCDLSYTIILRASLAGRGKQHEAAFISVMKNITKELSGFSVVDLFPSVKLLRVLSGRRAKLERLHRDADEILESIIEEHRTSKATSTETWNGDDDEEMIDLLDVLLNLQENGGLEFPLTTDNIKAVILDMLIAGTDTASTTVEWSMSEMMKNPRVLEKAQAEVRQVFDRTGGNVKESGLHELNYLKLVIKETLRLHPPGALLFPRENRGRCEINGYEIPAKTKVIVNAWAIGRDPNSWDEAERFNPERFVGSSIDYKGANFELIPFGAGRRICPGIAFGIANVELTLANLLYHFDWKLPNEVKPEHLDMTETFGTVVRRKRDLHLIPVPYYAPAAY